MKRKYQIHIEKDENNYYIGEVVGLPACYTQAKTLPELFDRLAEVTEGSNKKQDMYCDITQIFYNQ